MSGLEIIELLAILRAEVGRATMDFVTVMFGYLVCVHLIGANLSRAKALVLSVVYSIFSFFPMIGTNTSMTHMFAILSEHRADLVRYQELPESIVGSGMIALYFLTMISAWLISLGYMYQIRLSAHKAAGE